MDAWTTIRYRHAQGIGIRQLASELGLARNTVRSALRAEQAPVQTRGKRANPQLAPYHEQIRSMALGQRLIGSRILRELRAQGYTGGSTALYDHLRGLAGQTPDPRVTVRYETPPAQQGQFDWSPYTVSLGGSPVKLTVFGLVLGYSRRSFYWPSLDETQASVFDALEAGFQHFGGVPKELLVDNARVFVQDSRPDRFSWNPRFLELCGHYAIEPVACSPYWPRTKGKVERPFFYLEQQFIKGNTWADLGALERDLQRFIADDLDLRLHSTTRERPRDRFTAEQGLLTALPALPFIGTQEQSRAVSWDCLVSVGGSRYSVPWAYAGTRVWVRTTQGVRLRVRNQAGETIAEHTLSRVSGSTVIDNAHYAGLQPGVPKTRARVTETFRERFPEADAFLSGVLAQHPPNAVAHLRAILALADLYPAAAMTAAFAAAAAYHAYSHRFIRGVLEAGGQPVLPAIASAVPSQRPDQTALRADLSVYQALLDGAR